MAVGKLMGLKVEVLRRALGIAASMASGLRENFGTMTKPLHAGRAAENGVTAAQLAAMGFTAAQNILEAKRGFFNATAGGFDEAKISGRLGRPYFISDPGISIKPYPYGSLSHPAQDLIVDMVKAHDLHAKDIETIDVGTNSNVPNALIYPMPKTALEGKFSIPFCMAMGVLERKAGIAQFKDKKVREPKVVEFMKRVTLYVDDELEALGYDQVRSRIRIKMKDGRTVEGRADVARGHPLKPMSWAELGEKFRDCARLVLSKKNTEDAIEFVGNLNRVRSISPLIRATAGGKPKNTKKAKKRKVKSKRWSRTRKR
jgi:2-methylcitrate dehydratase PrpD